MARQPGLDDRYRDEDGQTRAKNGNTLIGTLRDTYGEDSDMKLETLLEQTGCSSLSEYLRTHRR